MKQLLIATTALVASASIVSADVSNRNAATDISFGGYARFGIEYNEDRTRDGEEEEWFIHHRWRLQIDTTTEADNGLVFGSRVRINRDVGTDGNVGINGAQFSVSAGDLTVRVGNILGAFEAMPGQYPIDLGLTGLNYEYTAYDGNSHAYSSGGAGSSNVNGIEVLYSMGDFEGHLSYTDETPTSGERIAGYVAYTFGDWTAALGLQDTGDGPTEDTDTEWTASISGDLGPAFVSLAYADNQDSGDRTVLAAQFDVGASTDVGGYISFQDEGTDEDTSFGIDFNHNMGGGTSLRGGVARLFDDTTVADLGFRFNF